MLRFIAIIFPFLFVCTNDLQTGIDFFNARSENAIGLQANAINVDKAIEVFDAQLKQNQNVQVAGGYYLQCLNFKGRFVYTDNADKKNDYNKAITIGNVLVKKYPKDGKIRFELISSIALLAEINGVLKGVESGVMSQLLYHTKELIKNDSLYNEGGGWKIWGVLNYKTPYIPLIMTWPDKEKAKEILKKSLKYFPASVGSNFYYGEALYENNEKPIAKIYFQLTIKLPSRKDFSMEDEYFKLKAKKYLAELEPA